MECQASRMNLYHHVVDLSTISTLYKSIWWLQSMTVVSEQDYWTEMCVFPVLNWCQFQRTLIHRRLALFNDSPGRNTNPSCVGWLPANAGTILTIPLDGTLINPSLIGFQQIRRKLS